MQGETLGSFRVRRKEPMKRSSALVLAVGIIASSSFAYHIASASASSRDTSCWDQYNLRGTTLVGTLVPAGVAKKDCTPAPGCWFGYRASDGKRNSWYVPHGSKPVTACGPGNTTAPVIAAAPTTAAPTTAAPTTAAPTTAAPTTAAPTTAAPTTTAPTTAAPTTAAPTTVAPTTAAPTTAAPTTVAPTTIAPTTTAPTTAVSDDGCSAVRSVRRDVHGEHWPRTVRQRHLPP